ncbi:4Fe-4S binding protein [Candidatus Altiarchaeota archaeon]
MHLAKAGIKTYLVEREPTIGGKMALLDKVFPALDCSQCILAPKMVESNNNENVEVMAYSEVVGVEGSVGDFKVKVRRRPRYVTDACVACGKCSEKCPTKVSNQLERGMSDRKAIYMPFPQAIPNKYLIDEEKCLYLTKGVCRLCEKKCETKAIDFEQMEEIVELEVGAIILATGFKIFDAEKKTEYGYHRYPNVIINLDFERLINACGPTEGRLKRPSDGQTPKKVAFIQCVGSRDENFAKYCSTVCCNITLKHCALIKEKYPETDVYVYYIDMRTHGKGNEEFYQDVRKKGVNFIRGRPGEILENEDKSLKLVAEDADTGILFQNDVDLVVLAAGFYPADGLEELNKILHVQSDSTGFLMEGHPNLRPTETNTDGIYICGCAQSPKPINDSVAQAGSAVASALDVLERDVIEVEGNVAEIDQEKCIKCRICEHVCPFNAISYNEQEDRLEVDEVMCKGCGLCNAACFSSAIQQRHFKDRQLIEQVKGFLEVQA